MSPQYGTLNPQRLTPYSLLVINGTVCPFCGTRFHDAEYAVECPNCKTPHHADCWKSNGDTCTNVTCQSQATTVAPIIMSNLSTTAIPQPIYSQPQASPQAAAPSCAQSGCGCLSTLIIPILAWAIYHSLEAALWVYLLGVALSVVALVGFIPVAGPFMYWNFANQTVMPRLMDAGHLTSTWLTTGILWVDLIASIVFSIISVVVIIGAIAGIIGTVRRN